MRDADVRAWVHVDPVHAMEIADNLERQSNRAGILQGLPIAIKDVIDVAGMPTRHNSLLSDPCRLKGMLRA